MSHFDLLGGEQPLRRVIDLFVERVFADVMIGFIFAGKNKKRIREMEYQLAAEQLGVGERRVRARAGDDLAPRQPPRLAEGRPDAREV